MAPEETAEDGSARLSRSKAIAGEDGFQSQALVSASNGKGKGGGPQLRQSLEEDLPYSEEAAGPSFWRLITNAFCMQLVC